MTATTFEEMLPVELSDGQDPRQFRMSQVQVLDWGAYCGLQTMLVSRSGTVLLGPSGRGKSTLLDAMSSVIMPNPQDFNQAARDDRGTGRERTVYTYARGYIATKRSENKVATSNEYLRGTNTKAFISGAAITWETKVGQRVTAFRLAWIGPDTADQSTVNRNTVYGFVHDWFDLHKLTELKVTGRANSPLTPKSFEPLIDLSRGDVVDTAQAALHSKMRTVMRLGSNPESQSRALDLLRRAQSSKGIGTINTLFSNLVLQEPKAMDVWETVLHHYGEATRLYKVFEDARRQLEVLDRLAGTAEKWRAARSDAQDKRRLYTSDGDGPSRLDVWHAEKIDTWADSKSASLLTQKNQLTNRITEAELAVQNVKRQLEETLGKITAAGGSQSGVAEERLKTAEVTLEQINRARRELAARLEEFALDLPGSAGEMDEIRSQVESLLEDGEQTFARYEAEAHKAGAAAWIARDAVTNLKEEIRLLKGRRSLIPDDADANRQRIASTLDIPVTNLVYAGELMEVSPEHRMWEKALIKVLHPLASTLLVSEDDYKRVRRYVYDASMRHVLHVEPVPAADHNPAADNEGSIAELIHVFDDHPFASWIISQIRTRFNYHRIAQESGLDTPRPAWSRGAVTPAGMTTGRRPGFTKDDRTFIYPWIGRDPSRLIDELTTRLDSLQDDAGTKDGKSAQANRDLEAARGRRDRLQALQRELVWQAIDTVPAQRLVDERRDDVTAANSPEVNALRGTLQKLLDEQGEANSDLTNLNKAYKNADDLHAAWCDVQDHVKDLLEQAAALTAEERHLLAGIPFKGPDDPGQTTPSHHDALAVLKKQVEEHGKAYRAYEDALLAVIGEFRSLDQALARRYEVSVDAVPALLHLHHELQNDSLPRAKMNWLKKTDQDLNEALGRLLTTIESDTRNIRLGLGSINNILKSVSFRQTSRLSIVPEPSSNQKNLDEFKKSITEYTSGTVGQDTSRDAGRIEATFRKLRERLSHLENQSRTSEAWRRSVFDAREHFDFCAIETKPDGTEAIYQGVAGMSGGEGQELIAFLLAAALRLRLAEGAAALPRYASIILDEGFVKSDSDYTASALKVLKALGFQLIVGSPREKANAFEDYMHSVAYISRTPEDPTRTWIYPMTMAEALELDSEEED